MSFFNSLRFKLMVTLLCVALVPLIGLSTFQLLQFNEEVTESIKAQELEIANSNSRLIDSWLRSKVNQLTQSYKAHPEFSKMEVVEINKFIQPIMDSDPELETTTAADKDGNAINILNNKPIPVGEREYFKKARDTKKTFISDVVISKATNNRVITVAVPIYDGDNFRGINFSMVNVKVLENYIGNVKVANTGYAFLLSSKGDVIFHQNEEWIGKSYKEFSKNPAKEQVFSNEILVKDKGFVTYKDDDGKEKIAAYSTVENTGWKVVVTAPTSEVYEGANKSRLVSGVIILIVAILIILMSILMAGFIAKPIKQAAEYLNVLANADFSKEVPGKFLMRKDEVGLLAKSVSVMSTSIRSVLNDVINETNSVKKHISDSSEKLIQLASEIEDVSATTEEMSAGMEETAASTEEMNATTTEIEGAIEAMAEKAQSGSAMVQEISYRAQNLKDNAVKSQKEAHVIRQTIDEDMRMSIEQSKAVEKINVLTESILQITSQTNLLALNAAIEAARAGEAGKGFAVVADEIRKLAEDSKNTVNEIQEVTKSVVSSVESLNQSSEKALNFIDTNVIRDYDAMVSTGEQYFKDAEAIQNLVMDFSATAQELSASIESMTRAIGEVTLSNNEGAEGAQNIAEKASDVMQKTRQVADLMKETEYNSQRLAEAVAKFKI